MPRDDYKVKVKLSYVDAKCTKGLWGMFYVKGLPFGPEEGVCASTASGAWRQAFWEMPIEERNKWVD